MSGYIYFLGTGCGKPKQSRQLPAYLISTPDNHSVMLECGTHVNEDDPLFPLSLSQLDCIIITALNIELLAGLPATLHAMRLMNRNKELKLIAPAPIEAIVMNLLSLDGIDVPFHIDFQKISSTDRIVIGNTTEVCVRESASMPGRYQVYIQLVVNGHDATVYYTGKSKSEYIPDTLVGHKIVIHDCTYAYDDYHLTAKTGLSSYRDVLDYAGQVDVAAIFLTHFSSRYSDPPANVALHRPVPANIVFAYDGLRYPLGPLMTAIS
ncbi:MAG: hypothetical protein H6642_12505 [Caldilineaceae bacterium]|nr:hypothetical protein [Caldilineaceae bacterium]